LSRDGDFTTGQVAPDVRTTNTRWTPRPSYVSGALPDSQASTAYHWFIQPCKTANKCGPDPRSTINPADHASRKTSPRVELESPASEEKVTTSRVTFDWKD